MAITLETVSRNAACNAVVDQLELGSGAGKLKIRDGSTLLVTITLQDPAFGSSSTGTATAAGLPLSGVAVAAGDADNYQVTDSADVLYWSGVVTETGNGGDLELDNTNIVIGQTVNLAAWSHTLPATP